MDFSIKTPDELFAYLQQIALTIYPDANWSGLQYGSLEWLMSQEVSYLTSLILQYLDARAKNAYIDTVYLRNDLRNIAKNLGLTVTEVVGATAEVQFTASNDVTIPIGTLVSDDNGITFATTSELILTTSSSLTDSVIAVNASYSQLQLKAQGNILETIQLNLPSVIEGLLSISVGGIVWTKVDDWSDSTDIDNHYIIKYDELNNASVVFGDGVYGKRLPSGVTVVLDIFYGGGIQGNSAGDITTLKSSFTNSSNITNITNITTASGGSSSTSLTTIKNQIPAQLRSISGLINKTDAGRTIKANLDWVADAKVATGYTTVGSVFVPTNTVVAFPNSTEIIEMSMEQASELTDFIDARGSLGSQWLVQDAYAQPLELELEVSLANRSLRSEKDALIKEVLAGDDGLFGFSNLSFNRVITDADLLDEVRTIDGITRVAVKKFAVIPQPFDLDSGISSGVVADADLGVNSEDGYFQFSFLTDTTAQADFYRPVLPDYIANTYIRDLKQNWLYKEYTFDDGDLLLNDTDGPYIKVSGSKLHFQQNETIFDDDELNGSTYLGKYLLKLNWTDASNDVQTAYYHIADTQKPGLIITLENANSPISGTAISATFDGAGYTNITVSIIKDQTNGSTGVLTTSQGNNLVITHNSANQLFLSTNPSNIVPVNDYSYIKFNELALDNTTSSWISYTQSLRLRMNISTGWTGQKFVVYTSSLNSKNLKFTHPYFVFTLNKNNINISYI